MSENQIIYYCVIINKAMIYIYGYYTKIIQKNIEQVKVRFDRFVDDRLMEYFYSHESYEILCGIKNGRSII